MHTPSREITRGTIEHETRDQCYRTQYGYGHVSSLRRRRWRKRCSIRSHRRLTAGGSASVTTAPSTSAARVLYAGDNLNRRDGFKGDLRWLTRWLAQCR